MKIAVLHVGDLQNLALGGVDQYVKNIIRNKGENDITIFGTCVRGKYRVGKIYDIEDGELKYKFVPVSDDKIRPLTVGYVLNESKYFNEFKQYDVIYAQRIELSIPFWKNRELRKKLIQIVHGSSYYTTIHWGLIKTVIYNLLEFLSISIAEKTNIVLLRNEFGVPYYKRKYSCFESKIGYAKIPVNTEIFKPLDKIKCRQELNLPLDKFLIVYGGRIENNPKRVFLLSDIMRKLIEENYNVYMVIVGNGNDLDRLSDLLSQNIGKDNFTIAGYVENRECLVKYLNAEDVNVNISEFEGTCTSSLEAVACGSKVLSTDVGDIKLFVKDGEDGYVIANNTECIVEEAVNTIKKIIDSEFKPSNLYMNYECKKVVADLFDEFKSLIKNA